MKGVLAPLLKLIAFAVVTILATSLLAVTIANVNLASATEYKAQFTDVTLLLHDGLMFIGGGSAGTAGGIKVTTFALLGFVILSVSALAVIQQFRQARQQATRARGMTYDRAADDAGEPLVEPPPPPRTI